MPARSSPAPCCSSTSGTTTSTRRPTSSTSTCRGCGPRSTAILTRRCCIPCAAQDTCCVTILAKLFRATAFKLTLVIFGLSVVGSALVLGVVAWQVIKLVDAETQQTIEEQAKGLAEQYDAGGVRRLGEVIEKRSRQPGSSLYLLTNNAGEPLAGNVAQLPPGVLDHV